MVQFINPLAYKDNLGRFSVGTRVTFSSSLFYHVPDHASDKKTVKEQLLSMCKRNQEAAEFDLEFKTLDDGTGGKEPAHKAAYHQRLNMAILSKITLQSEETTVYSICRSTSSFI